MSRTPSTPRSVNETVSLTMLSALSAATKRPGVSVAKMLPHAYIAVMFSGRTVHVRCSGLNRSFANRICVGKGTAW